MLTQMVAGNLITLILGNACAVLFRCVDTRKTLRIWTWLVQRADAEASVHVRGGWLPTTFAVQVSSKLHLNRLWELRPFLVHSRWLQLGLVAKNYIPFTFHTPDSMVKSHTLLRLLRADFEWVAILGGSYLLRTIHSRRLHAIWQWILKLCLLGVL